MDQRSLEDNLANFVLLMINDAGMTLIPNKIRIFVAIAFPFSDFSDFQLRR